MGVLNWERTSDKGLTIDEVTRQLIDGLDNDFNEVKEGLEKIQSRYGLSLPALNTLCWEDSVTIFDLIYMW